VTFDGFDTHREAVAQVEQHIRDEQETKRADQLAVGDWVSLLADHRDPWETRRNTKVAAVFPYTDEVENDRVLLVTRTSDAARPWTNRLLADQPVRVLTADELAAVREQAERATKIADIRAFADFLEQHPDLPVTHIRMQASLNPHGDVWNSGAEGVAEVQRLAGLFDCRVKQDDEHITATREVGATEYVIVAWHKDGRPAEAITCNWCTDPASPDPALHPGDGRTHVPADDLGFGFSRQDDDPQVIRPHSPRVPLHTGAVVDGGVLVDETPAESPASGLTLAADLSRGPLAGTTPVVTYFSFGHGQTDPDTGQKLIDHYVTVVAPTYEECRAAMFASRFGRAWSFDYLAGRAKTTEAVSEWTEHEVIMAPGTDPALGEAALKAAAALLVDEPVAEAR
jgi:hypothetical protein